jgi:hypothetical protein
MPHLVLLGDSIFDNQSYVTQGKPVSLHLRSLLPSDWKITLLAVDGSKVARIPAQLARLPGDASHLVMSIGGNDALGNLNVVSERVPTVGEALRRIHEMMEDFEHGYRDTLGAVIKTGLPATVCTIYGGLFREPLESMVTSAALAFFNDVILRCAFAKHLPVIDLRLVCSEPSDYANPIEPSSKGGLKIAHAIQAAVVSHDPSAIVSTIYAV